MMMVYTVAKPGAHFISEEEAQRIKEEAFDAVKFNEIMESAEQFERLCLREE